MGAGVGGSGGRTRRKRSDYAVIQKMLLGHHWGSEERQVPFFDTLFIAYNLSEITELIRLNKATGEYKVVTSVVCQRKPKGSRVTTALREPIHAVRKHVQIDSTIPIAMPRPNPDRDSFSILFIRNFLIYFAKQFQF